jgi:hypothetical protein
MKASVTLVLLVVVLYGEAYQSTVGHRQRILDIVSRHRVARVENEVLESLLYGVVLYKPEFF